MGLSPSALRTALPKEAYGPFTFRAVFENKTAKAAPYSHFSVTFDPFLATVPCEEHKVIYEAARRRRELLTAPDKVPSFADWYSILKTTFAGTCFAPLAVHVRRGTLNSETGTFEDVCPRVTAGYLVFVPRPNDPLTAGLGHWISPSFDSTEPTAPPLFGIALHLAWCMHIRAALRCAKDDVRASVVPRKFSATVRNVKDRRTYRTKLFEGVLVNVVTAAHRTLHTPAVLTTIEAELADPRCSPLEAMAVVVDAHMRATAGPDGVLAADFRALGGRMKVSLESFVTTVDTEVEGPPSYPPTRSRSSSGCETARSDGSGSAASSSSESVAAIEFIIDMEKGPWYLRDSCSDDR